MNSSDLFIFAVAVFVFAIKPGPGVVFFTSLAVSEGIVTALVTAIGTDIGHFIITLILLTGADAIDAPPLAITVIQLFAAIYVGYIGVKQFFATPVAPNRKVSRGLLFMPAMLVRGVSWSVANPTNIAFYLAIFPTLLDVNGAVPLDKAVLIAGIAAGAFFLAQVFYISFAATTGQFFANLEERRWVFRLSGLVMIGLAAIIIWVTLASSDLINFIRGWIG